MSELACMKEYRERQNRSSRAPSILGEGSGREFRKRRGTRDQIADIRWIERKQGNFRRTSVSLTDDGLWLCVGRDKPWKALRDGNTRPSYLSPEKPIV